MVLGYGSFTHTAVNVLHTDSTFTAVHAVWLRLRLHRFVLVRCRHAVPSFGCGCGWLLRLLPRFTGSRLRFGSWIAAPFAGCTAALYYSFHTPAGWFLVLPFGYNIVWFAVHFTRFCPRPPCPAHALPAITTHLYVVTVLSTTYTPAGCHYHTLPRIHTLDIFTAHTFTRLPFVGLFTLPLLHVATHCLYRTVTLVYVYWLHCRWLRTLRFAYAVRLRILCVAARTRVPAVLHAGCRFTASAVVATFCTVTGLRTRYGCVTHTLHGCVYRTLRTLTHVTHGLRLHGYRLHTRFCRTVARVCGSYTTVLRLHAPRCGSPRIYLHTTRTAVVTYVTHLHTLLPRSCGAVCTRFCGSAVLHYTYVLAYGSTLYIYVLPARLHVVPTRYACHLGSTFWLFLHAVLVIPATYVLVLPHGCGYACRIPAVTPLPTHYTRFGSLVAYAFTIWVRVTVLGCALAFCLPRCVTPRCLCGYAVAHAAA